MSEKYEEEISRNPISAEDIKKLVITGSVIVATLATYQYGYAIGYQHAADDFEEFSSVENDD